MIQKPARGRQRLSALARMLLDTPELREAYDALLAGLRLNVTFNSGKSILVTSTQPSEGKSTVASCLAVTASLAGQTVLLIDGDLRRPWLVAAVGIPDGIGFGEILDGQTDAAEAVHLVGLFDETRDACQLNVMGAGRKAPTFLAGVDWPRARTAFRALSRQFGIVFLDSPPILAANDALLLAGIVDGILLVVGADANTDEVRRAKQQLDPIGTPVIGAVLNQFDPKLHGRSNQPYRGYYLNS